MDAEEIAVRVHEIINTLNSDDNVHGIMIQLPFSTHISSQTKNALIHSIASSKDVDGMTNNSSFPTPVVHAIVDALAEAGKVINPLKNRSLKIVGAEGFVGKRLLHTLQKKDWEDIEGLDIETKNLTGKTREADVLISVTGVPEIITADMVKEGSVLIDVGAPRGDISKDAYAKASFVSPVPGGVGPVTISSLLENLINASSVVLG